MLFNIDFNIVNCLFFIVNVVFFSYNIHYYMLNKLIVNCAHAVPCPIPFKKESNCVLNEVDEDDDFIIKDHNNIQQPMTLTVPVIHPSPTVVNKGCPLMFLLTTIAIVIMVPMLLVKNIYTIYLCTCVLLQISIPLGLFFILLQQFSEEEFSLVGVLRAIKSAVVMLQRLQSEFVNTTIVDEEYVEVSNCYIVNFIIEFFETIIGSIDIIINIIHGINVIIIAKNHISSFVSFFKRH
jgi:hypothetical protein